MLVGQRRLWWRYMIRAHVRLREYRQLFGYSRCCKVGWNSLAELLTALRCISFVCSYTLKGQQSNLTILKTACCVWSIFSFMLSSLQGMISSCFGVTPSTLHIFMWTRSLLRLRKQIRIGFFLNLPMYNYVVSGKWFMVIALFCSAWLHRCPGNKAESFWDSGSSALGCRRQEQPLLNSAASVCRLCWHSVHFSSSACWCSLSLVCLSVTVNRGQQSWQCWIEGL